jgi:hypothetical protein
VSAHASNRRKVVTERERLAVNGDRRARIGDDGPIADVLKEAAVVAGGREPEPTQLALDVRRSSSHRRRCIVAS